MICENSAFDPVRDMTKEQHPASTTTARSPSASPLTRRQIDTEQLMQGDDHLEIVHRGVVYRLSITRQGKLILTK